jgi:undecaprenyl-phosphate galactose phosphotransferase
MESGRKIRILIFPFLLATGDLVGLYFSFLIAYFFRASILTGIIQFHQPPLPFWQLFQTTFIWTGAVILIIFIFERLYVQNFTLWDEAYLLLKSITISFAIIMLFAFLSRKYEQFSRAVILFTWFWALFLIPFARYILKTFLFHFKNWRKNIFILGTNKLAFLVAKEIKRNKTLGYEIKGFLTDRKEKIGQLFAGYPVLGTIEDLRRLSHEHCVKDIIIAVPLKSANNHSNILKIIEEEIQTIKIVPSFGQIYSSGVKVEVLGDVICLNVPRSLFKRGQLFIKGIFEFIIATIIAIFFLPLFFFISLAIKLDSPGPVFYKQKRLGKNGKLFDLIKFRSMYIDGDIRLAAYLEKNPQAREEWETYRKLRGYDPRVTPVGRLLRKFSLDELPQLFNFFKRDINLIGPRPYMPEEIAKMSEKYHFILRIKPGITGLWQVRGRNLLTFNERLLLDEFYIRNWSLWLDIVILIKTIKAVVTREGAF